MIQDIPTKDLIDELQRRRAEIDAALEGRLTWESRTHPVLATVASQWGLSAGRLFQKSRELRITEARQSAMVILREKGETYQTIADLFGMNHGTVIHAVSTHEKRMSDRLFASRFHAAKKLIDP